MSDRMKPVKYLEGTLLAGTPNELERSLSEAMRRVGGEIVRREEIVRSLAAAEMLNEGYVIVGDAQAAEVADLVAQVIDGEKVLSAAVRDAGRIPKAMEAALKASVESVKTLLAKARQVGNEARVNYQAALRAQAIREEEKRRQEAREAAEAAATEAALTGEDAPPEMEVGKVEVARTVAGGIGKMGTQVRIQAEEIEDWAQVPREWLRLEPSIARAAFLAACMEKKAQKPEPGETVVFKGVRFTAIESAVNRR
jgi:hypothetical protein